MYADPLITHHLLAAARRDGPSAERRCRAVLMRSAGVRALHTALQRQLAWGGLTESGFKMLTVLQAHDPAPVPGATVAAAAGLTPARAGGALTRLEMSRLVRRERAAGDRRVWLRLTPAGSERISAALRRFVAAVVTVTGAMEEPDLTACLALSEKLHAGLARLDPPTPPPAAPRS